MKKALEGLPGVAKVEMDVERDLFRITLADKDAPPVKALLSVVRDLGYMPRRVAPDKFQPGAASPYPQGDPPEIVKAALARAKSEGKKFVLAACMGDN